MRPARTNRPITEDAANAFVTTAVRLCKAGVAAEVTSHLLTQCLFCFFAEDVGLLPAKLFERLVNNRDMRPEVLRSSLQTLFEAMCGGGMFGAESIPWFNGGLFQTIEVPPLTVMDVAALRNAAVLDRSAIDPSIFGTLFERGLDPKKRSQLGAHYTDPATIMRLVEPVVQRPLKAEWERVKDAIAGHVAKSKRSGDAEYRHTLDAFVGYLEKLREFCVLDPACGSGNFLYLALKCLKDLEHQANIEAEALGLQRQVDAFTSPANVLGIELNEYAAELARVTVWIGELQWRLQHGYPFKVNPILEPLDQIECRDALMNADGSEAVWPRVSVVIGNPPFLGGKKFVSELGESYSTSLRVAFKNRIPGLADLVVYWLEKARASMTDGYLSAAGFVATNSIRDGFGRQVLARINDSTPIYDAWSDEPWVNDGAAVRVSMIAFSPFVSERRLDGESVSAIAADLSAVDIGCDIDVTRATAISGNKGVTFQGTTRSGPFDVTGDLARSWLQLPNPNGKSNAEVVRPWSNGLDVTRRPSDTWVIDFGVCMSKSAAAMYERPFEHCRLHVQPTRVGNRNLRLVEQWWHYDGVRVGMRRAIAPLPRYVATTITAKYRLFVWFHPSKLPDATLVALTRSDDAFFGVVHSTFHERWSLAMGSWLGVGNDPRYTPGATFETFPFPTALTPADTAHQRTKSLPDGAVIPADLPPSVRPHAEAIARAAKHLNDLRERWLNPPEWTRREPEVVPLGMVHSPYPDRILPRDGFEAQLAQRTLTKLYNERPNWLAQAHEALDAAVAAAYGWADYTPAMPDEEILRRLLALNRERSRQ